MTPAKQGGTGVPGQSSGTGLGGMLGGLIGGGGRSTGGGFASMLDMNGDGNPLDDILRMAGRGTR